MIRLTGTLTCVTSDDLAVVQTCLPDHMRLSRAEPGCIRFDVTQSPDPMIWLLDETYVDRTAFEAHQARNRASVWWARSQALVRDFQLLEEDTCFGAGVMRRI